MWLHIANTHIQEAQNQKKACCNWKKKLRKRSPSPTPQSLARLELKRIMEDVNLVADSACHLMEKLPKDAETLRALANFMNSLADKYERKQSQGQNNSG